MQSTISLLLAFVACASAAVSDSSAGGFTVKLTSDIHASPDEVYTKLVRNLGDWWDPAHTFSRDPHNLTIEERAGGCFCEKIRSGGGVRHMEVVYFVPGKTLVMIGALGPLQSLAATGSMTIALSPVAGGTKLDLTYAVSGYLAAGMNTWAQPVDGMLAGQLARLKNFAEHGKP